MPRTVFIPYQPKTILNKSKRPDHWFWTRYSAYPYLGCQHGCEFCYCREQKYFPLEKIEDFPYQVKVKENAPLLLRKALSRLPVDVIMLGDYQPAERKFQLTRRMLEVCLEFGFPVFVLTRSHLVLRDLDLLQAIHQKARVVVGFSIITTPDSPHHEQVRILEGLARPVSQRFSAMEQVAKAGLPTGVCFMPVLPGFCDDPENVHQVARWTAGHGGSFILTSSLTLSDQQREYFFGVLATRFPEHLPMYWRLYPPGSYNPAGYPWLAFARQVRSACRQFGLIDRMPRPIIPGDKRALNKQIVETLANRAYELEIQDSPQYQVWALRKAAWAIEDLEQDIALLYRSLGRHGLESIPEVGPGLAAQIERFLHENRVKLAD